MSLAVLALMIIATFGTAFLSSMFGMLGGLILIGILANLMPIGAAMVLHGLIQLTSNGYRAWLNRTDVQWSIIGYFGVGGLVALGLLTWVDFSPDRITVLLSLGVMPYLALASPKAWALDAAQKPLAFLAGWLVVFINLLTGVAGPLLDLFFQQDSLTRHQVVATKAVLASMGHVAKIIFFGALASNASTQNWPEIWLIGLAIIASVLGTRLGKYALDTMQDKTFFAWTQRILLVVGAVLIARAVQLIMQG